MWILACGMIRSGSTLQYQIAAELVEQSGAGYRISWVPEAEFPLIENRHRDLPGHKVFKAHTVTPDFERLCREHDARVLYSYRDLRDVATSASRKFGLTIDELLERGWFDQAIADGARWRLLPRVLVSRYEDFAADIKGEVDRIACFLDLSLSRARIEEIANMLSMEKQRRRIDEAVHGVGAVASSGTVCFDPHSLLHHNHINEGEIGGWRKLPIECRARLMERYGWWLAAEGYSV
jgi:Sulfotransferase domain